MSKNPSVIVIGAGAAGIAAATKLLENGFINVTILEAENRIGGRIHSVDFGGSIVDIGGQWVHGDKGNVVYEMVKNLDLLSTSHNKYDDNTYYLSNGTVADKHITDRLHKIGIQIIEDEERAKRDSGTFGDYFIKVYNENVLKEFGSNKEIIKLATLLESWFHKFFVCLDSAKTWFDISTTGAFVFQRCDGDQQLNWRDKGYRTILYVLMKKIPDITKQLPLDDKVLLNKEVTKIVWDDNSTNNGGVTVNCTDGSSYNADHVIVTTSVGVLKKFHKTLFDPELPLYKVNSVEGLPLGTVNKILLKFPKKWWPNDLKGFSLLWTDEDRLNLVNEFPHFDPSDNGRSWLEDIFGFYVIDSHPRVLLGWVVGKLAAEVELLPDEVVVSGSISKWNSNPHFCGSYSHVSIEAENKKASAEDLARPLVSKNSKQTVLFAGEATHATKFSTVHGAIETGYREAERLINIYNGPEYSKIVILGAGMAGLGAAMKLTELDCKEFLILEAQDQPGGRINTVVVDGKPLDIGAQWLHGKDTPLYDMALKYNLLSEKTSEEGLGIFIRNDGIVFDEFLVKQIDFQIGKILEQFGDFLEEQFLEYLDSCVDTDEIRQMKLELFDWHLRFQIIDNSCHNMRRLSAKYWGSYICLDDIAHYNLKYGYQSLVNVIVNSLPKECIRLKTEVTSIDFSNKLHSCVVVNCSENKIVYCDHLIITASIGVLKDFSDITPPLPKYLRDSINDVGFYGIGKIYLFFNEKWWGDSKGFQFIWKSGTVLEEREEWIRHMTGFDEVFNQPTALIGWVGSHGVEQMESLCEEEVAIYELHVACNNVAR
ncbi:hypothetical protein NQ314_015064 [Rhamnusium bicolor]|uniref:Amine oxidase domain-containing protein n=1 Tax=Rhamnusium bicolor TaxID=1586634 RepID=A0AAV8X0E5_9CUCU|nr:hypothetical protein NQ314_015064 [Rhamnusium bicolor]